MPSLIKGPSTLGGLEISMPRKKIDSWEQAQKQIKSILSKVNADKSLAIAAALNPLFALEELEYDLSPEARQSVEDRIRFEPQTVKQLVNLRESIFQHAGHSFDINSADELRKVLFEELKLTSYPGTDKPTDQQGYPHQRYPTGGPTLDTKPLPFRRDGKPPDDPLAVLREKHPIMEPLLEYRRLQATHHQFAPRDLFDAVRQGKRQLRVKQLTARLKETRNNR
jgi:hypothetical protein